MPVNANIYRIRNGNETLIASGVSTPYDASGDDIQEGDEIVVELANGAQRTTVEIAPSISNYSVTNPSGSDVQVSFDSDEQLGSNSGDIAVPIEDSGTNVVVTLSRTDFSESGSGPYTYTATYTVSSDDTYTATLDTAKDPRGNDYGGSLSASATVNTTAPT